MSWHIERVYTLPESSVIDFFKNTPEKPEVYLINNLEGIRSEYTRDVIFSSVATEQSAMQHGLPEGGLLAVKPAINTYSSGKDQDVPGATNIDNNLAEQLPAELDLNDSHIRLFSLLKQINDKTGVPLMYFQCATWGGLTEEEFSVVFDGGIYVYWEDADNEQCFELRNGEAVELQTSVLQKGLGHVGLSLPTYFFALHESDFDWQRYRI